MIMHIYKLASGGGLYHRTIPGTRWTFCDQSIADFTEDRVIGNDAAEPDASEWCLACRPRSCTKLTPPHEYLIQHPVDKSPPLVTHLNSLPPFPGMRRSYWMGYTGAQLLLVLARHELPAAPPAAASIRTRARQRPQSSNAKRSTVRWASPTRENECQDYDG